MRTKLVCELRRDGEIVETREFRGLYLRIGSLESSDWVIAGAAPRQLLVAHDPRNPQWEAISVKSGVTINGEPLNESFVLTSAGTISFGDMEIRFTIASDSLTEAFEEYSAGSRARALARWMEDERRTLNDDPSHHERLVKALIEELRKNSPHSDLSTYEQVVMRWGSFSMHRKIKLIRSLIEVIRRVREGEAQTTKMLVASAFSLGADGFTNIYKMPPEAALQRAKDTALRLTNAHATMELLRKLNLEKTLRADATKPQTVATLRGFESLMTMLEADFVSGVTLLVTLLGRAGGYEMTEEERAALHEAFEQAMPD